MSKLQQLFLSWVCGPTKPPSLLSPLGKCPRFCGFGKYATGLQMTLYWQFQINIFKKLERNTNTFIQTKDHCSHSINDLILNKNKTVQIIVFHTKNTLSTALPNLELKQATKMQVSLTWGTYLENKTRTWSRHSQSLL